MKKISVIGVPMGLGAGRRGVELGPAALRHADVIEHLTAMGLNVEDRGDIEVPRKLSKNEHPMKHRPEVLAVNKALAEEVKQIKSEGSFPLILGGDHSLAIGSIAGIAENEPKIGIVWVDAHGDFNDISSSPSGNIHGMPLAISCGIGDEEFVNIGGYKNKIDPKRVVVLAARDLDGGEVALLKEHGVTVYTMEDIDLLGIRVVMQEVIEYLKEQCDAIHVSYDIDSVDPALAPGTGTAVLGGLTYREAHFIMESLYESGLVQSLDMVEVNPLLDDQNKTAELAVNLLESAFGKRIMRRGTLKR